MVRTPSGQIAISQQINFYNLSLMIVELNTSTRMLKHEILGTYGITLPNAKPDFVMIALVKTLYPILSKQRNVVIHRKSGKLINTPFTIDIDLDTKTITERTMAKLDISTVPKGQEIKIILNEYTITLGVPNATKQGGKEIIGYFKILLTKGADNVALIAHLKRLHPHITKFRNVEVLQKTRKNVIMKLDFDKLIAHTLENRENQDTLKKDNN